MTLTYILSEGAKYLLGCVKPLCDLKYRKDSFASYYKGYF